MPRVPVTIGSSIVYKTPSSPDVSSTFWSLTNPALNPSSESQGWVLRGLKESSEVEC